MNKYVYILFGESGYVISKLLKADNNKNKIIHFFEQITSTKKKSYADEIINLHEGIDYSLGLDGNHYDFINEEKVQEKINRIIKNIENAIIIHDVIESDYSLTIDITKKMIENNKTCINIFCKPFDFFGKRHIEAYRKFYKKINQLNDDNYYFDCNNLRNILYKKMDFFKVIELVYEIQYNISVNIDCNIDKIINKVVLKYNKMIKDILNKQLTIFIGGAGKSILSKYKGDLNCICISNSTILKSKKERKFIVLDEFGNYLDGGGINYKIHIEGYKKKEKDIIKHLNNKKNVLIVCGLGGIYGTAGFLYLSNLCEKLKINCNAILSTPFSFEGKARCSAAQESLNVCKCKNTIIINMEKYKKKIFDKEVKEGTVCNYFPYIDNLFINYLDKYEYFYINEDRLYGENFINKINKELE